MGVSLPAPALRLAPSGLTLVRVRFLFAGFALESAQTPAALALAKEKLGGKCSSYLRPAWCCFMQKLYVRIYT